MESIFFALAGLFILGNIGSSICREQGYSIELNLYNAYRFLLGWVIVGYILAFDYSPFIGYVNGLEFWLDVKKILFSTVSFGLIYWAFKTEKEKLKLGLGLIELGFWILKLMIYKEIVTRGYAAGYSSFITMYDLIALAVRLYIVSELFKISKFRYVSIAVIALLVVSIKISAFSIPPYALYQMEQSRLKAQEMRQEMMGHWTGTYQKLEYNKRLFSNKTKVYINHDLIYFENVEGLQLSYYFRLSDEYYGWLSEDGEGGKYDCYIQTYNEDELEFRITNFENDYVFELKKENRLN